MTFNETAHPGFNFALRSAGLVSPLPGRAFVEDDMADPRPKTWTPEKFNALTKLNEKTGCLEWTGYMSGVAPRNYGCTRYKSKGIAAHRLSWILNVGPIPRGLWVLHKCDNPPCCNPDHLFLGTNRDNVTDRDKKGRTPRGSWHSCAKLTEDQVLEFLSMSRAGIRRVDAARVLCVSPKTLSEIISGRSWGWFTKIRRDA